MLHGLVRWAAPSYTAFICVSLTQHLHPYDPFNFDTTDQACKPIEVATYYSKHKNGQKCPISTFTHWTLYVIYVARHGILHTHKPKLYRQHACNCRCMLEKRCNNCMLQFFHIASYMLANRHVEIIKLYLVQTGRFLATTGYVAPANRHVWHRIYHNVKNAVAIVKVVLVALLRYIER